VHRQVNTRLELTAELIDLGLPWLDHTTPDIERALDDAHRELNAHACVYCETYYPEVLGRSLILKGQAELPYHATEALKLCKKGVEELRRAETQLRSMKHPKEQEIARRIEDTNAMIVAESRPRKIFLSHSSHDKEVVRQFKALLETVGFEPWLDEDAMVAGTPLERGLHAGMQESCAAVFFITENFEDSSYLATEIDYAIEQQRKNEHFATVTLVLSDAIKNEKVPVLLRRFVYKRPRSLILAANELVRALPLMPLRPVWRDRQ
jgi:hypothetical protein